MKNLFNITVVTVFIKLLLVSESTAQMRISFNGFSCSKETNDGSGSDEIYFIMNVYKDGKWLKTIKFPSKVI